MACLESIFCGFFANIFVTELRVYTIQYGACFLMQLSFYSFQVENEYVA